MNTTNKVLIPLLCVVFSACTTLKVEERITEVGAATKTSLKLMSGETERQAAAQKVELLLQQPLSREDAVNIALLQHPELQALLANTWAEMAQASQVGRIANPVLTFERLLNVNVLDLGRMLSVGIFDLITLPQRQQVAAHGVTSAQWQLALAVVERVQTVRQAWVNALAAKQLLAYAKQAQTSAEASAELARRMQQVGNFSKLQRARQQAFYADTSTMLAQAEHQAIATREQLIRALGLTAKHTTILKLPERLPDLPKDAKSPEVVAKQASGERLDQKLSAAQLSAALAGQRLGGLTSFTDIELAGIRNTELERADGHKTRTRGYEVAVRLPLFDLGDLQRQALAGKTLAALNQHEATQRAAASELREAYSAYRSSHDIARHYRDEVLPLYKQISEENVLRYNGMLIGVFELLADSRQQISTVMDAIKAEQAFWLADVALEATILGRPMSSTMMMMSSTKASGSEGGH